MKPQRLGTKAAENIPSGILIEYELIQGDNEADGSATLTTAYGEKKDFTFEIETVHRIESLAGVERRTNQLV